MKKTITMILAVCLLVLTACRKEPTTKSTIPKDSSFLLEKGLTLISQVDAIAENKEYIELQVNYEEIKTIIADVAKGDYKEPKQVFTIKNVGDTLFQVMSLDQKVSENCKEVVKDQLANLPLQHLTAQSGAYNLAAASILSYGDSFLFEGLTTDVTYVYTYDSKYSFMVSFIPDDEEIVTAKAMVVIDEDLAEVKTAEDIKALLNDALGFGKKLESITVEEKKIVE